MADNDIENNIDGSNKQPKKLGTKTIVLICVLVVTLALGVAVYAGGGLGSSNKPSDELELAATKTLDELKNESIEATGADITKYFYETEITDFEMSGELSDLGLKGAFNANAGKEVLTSSVSVNDIVAKFMLGKDTGVLNFGSENYYGFDTAEVGEKLYEALIPYTTTEADAKSLEALKTLDYGYNGPGGSLKERQSNPLSTSYLEYVEKIYNEATEKVERKEVRGTQKVEKDGVTFDAKAFENTVTSADAKEFTKKLMYAAFLFNEANAAGEYDTAIDFETATLTNQAYIDANDEFVKSLDAFETDIKVTFYVADEIIVQTKVEFDGVDNATDEKLYACVNLYILDTKNVLDNIQFDVVDGEDEVLKGKISSLNSGDTNEVGLDFYIEDESSKLTFGYKIDTTANKADNAVFYVNDGYSVDLQLPFTYNIIDGAFVFSIDNEIEGMPFKFNIKLGDKQNEETMPTATDSIYDLNENTFVEKEPALMEKMQTLIMSFYQ